MKRPIQPRPRVYLKPKGPAYHSGTLGGWTVCDRFVMRDLAAATETEAIRAGRHACRGCFAAAAQRTWTLREQLAVA